MSARRWLVVVIASLTFAAACSGANGSTAPTTGGQSTSTSSQSTTTTAPATTTTAAAQAYTGADFYSVPNPLPAGKPGTLLRYQQIAGLSFLHGTAYRVMYLSQSLAGDAIAVTGTIVVPSAAAPAGGRKVIAVAHGTSGIADECAPSKNPSASEIALTGPFLDAGDIVAATDYEGLGTPGRHPYLVGESEGRGVLDAARAAAGLPDASASTDIAIVGYSQGGHAALWANQIAKAWAPELHVFGTVAGAPATEMSLIFQSGASGAGGFFYMLVAGFQAAYPQADPALVLTPAGVSDLSLVDQGCVGQVLGAFAKLKSSDLVKPNPQTIAPWDKLVAADNPGQVATADPILIVQSQQDDVVPIALSATLYNRLCGLHQVVERRVYNKGQGHVAAVPDAYHDAFVWIQARFAGDAPVNGCTS